MLGRARRQVATAGRPPFRHALTVIAIAIVMVSLFVASYSLALGRPTIHHIPAAVIGPQSSHPALVRALEAATHDGLHRTPLPTVAAAERQIAEQRIYAALVLSGPRPQLLIASSAGTSVARVLEQAANTVSSSGAGSLQVRDLNPLPAGDPQGLVSFYATLAATILGFVTMFQLRANASGLSLRAWWAAVILVAVVGGLSIGLVVDPVIGALHAPFLELWLALSVQVAVAALFNSTMITLVGRWAMIPTWGFFVAFGNASSGGAVAAPLLPAWYGFLSRFIPSGATIELLRNATYFRAHQHLEPALVEAAWLAGTVVSFVLASRWRGAAPAQM